LDELSIGDAGEAVEWTVEGPTGYLWFWEPNYDKFSIGTLDQDGQTIVLPSGSRVPVAVARTYSNAVNTAGTSPRATMNGRPIEEVWRTQILANLEGMADTGDADSETGGVAGFAKGAFWNEPWNMVKGLAESLANPIDTTTRTVQFFTRPYHDVERDLSSAVFESLDAKLDTAEGKGELFFAAASSFAAPEAVLDDLARLRAVRDLARIMGDAESLEDASRLSKIVDAADTGVVRYAEEVFEGVATARVGDGPYSPHAVREALEQRYPGQVTSTTVPPVNPRNNVHLAGTRHHTGVVFDQRGFPIFDDVTKVDLQISAGQVAGRNYRGQMRAATRALRDRIDSGAIPASRFTSDQIRAIMGGRDKIPDFTWHHHQEVGRMQLVPEGIHADVGHIGGFEMWYGR
jgi:hypothetical protein